MKPSTRGLLVIPLLVLSATKGLMSRQNGKRGELIYCIVMAVVDGMACTGGIFASLDGGRAGAVWLCVGAAAVAGFYRLPLKIIDTRFGLYSSKLSPNLRRHVLNFASVYSGRGRQVIAIMLIAAVSAGIYMLRDDNDAAIFILFTLIPPILLLLESHKSRLSPDKLKAAELIASPFNEARAPLLQPTARATAGWMDSKFL